MLSTHLVIAQYRDNSDYSDLIGQQYHFPRKYLNFLSLPAVRFIYFEPSKKGKGEFFGFGEVENIKADASHPNHYFAMISHYKEFPRPVAGMDEFGVRLEHGPFYNRQNSVRKIDASIFAYICRKGGLSIEP